MLDGVCDRLDSAWQRLEHEVQWFANPVCGGENIVEHARGPIVTKLGIIEKDTRSLRDLAQGLARDSENAVVKAQAMKVAEAAEKIIATCERSITSLVRPVAVHHGEEETDPSPRRRKRARH